MEPSRCHPDRTGADWFMCALGTVACPIIHDGRTPHCIACTANEPCRFEHDPPALEMSREDWAEVETPATRERVKRSVKWSIHTEPDHRLVFCGFGDNYADACNQVARSFEFLGQQGLLVMTFGVRFALDEPPAA